MKDSIDEDIGDGDDFGDQSEDECGTFSPYQSQPPPDLEWSLPPDLEADLAARVLEVKPVEFTGEEAAY